MEREGAVMETDVWCKTVPQTSSRERKRSVRQWTVSDNNATKIVSCCQRTLQGEGHSAAGWGIHRYVCLADTVGPKSVRAMDGR